MTRVLEIEMQDTDNKDIKQTISYTNPATADTDLLDFTEGLVNLTTNTHIRTKKVDTSVLVRS